MPAQEASVAENLTVIVGIRYSRAPIIKYAASNSDVDFLEMTIMNFFEKARSLSLSQKVAFATGLLGSACMVSLLLGTELRSHKLLRIQPPT